MAVGLEYVESLQTGHETSPELQEKFDAVHAAVLGPMKSMLGLDRVSWAGSASAPMPIETARFFAGLGLSIYDIYGMTETTGSVTACGPHSFRLGTVGRAQPGIEIAIADDGEILTRGPVNTSGYHKNPEASAELIDDDGWVHTGDIGELDDDGFLKVVDRKKEMIITSSGKNIAPVQHREPPQGEPARRPRPGVRREQALRRRDPHPRPRRRAGDRRQARGAVRRPGRPRAEAGDPRRRRARPSRRPTTGSPVPSRSRSGSCCRSSGPPSRPSSPPPSSSSVASCTATTPTRWRSCTHEHQGGRAASGASGQSRPLDPRPRPRRDPLAQLRRPAHVVLAFRDPRPPGRLPDGRRRASASTRSTRPTRGGGSTARSTR